VKSACLSRNKSGTVDRRSPELPRSMIWPEPISSGARRCETELADIQGEGKADAGSAIRPGFLRQSHPSFARTIHDTKYWGRTALRTVL